MFVRKQVESKRVPMINIGTLFICYVLYPGFFKQTVSVVRIEILVVIQKELCQYRHTRSTSRISATIWKMQVNP